MLVLKRTIQKLWSFFRSSMLVGTSRFMIYLMGIDLSWRIPVHYSWLESTRRKLSIDYSRVKSILFLALLTSLASGIYISPNWLLMARSTNPTDRKAWREKRSCWLIDWLYIALGPGWEVLSIPTETPASAGYEHLIQIYTTDHWVVQNLIWQLGPSLLCSYERILMSAWRELSQI